MHRVMLVDYLGNASKDGSPVGHPVKILKEYRRIIEQDFEVCTVAPKSTITYLKVSNKYQLRFFHNIECVGILQRTIRMMKDFLNLIQVGKYSKEFDTIWFCNVDYVLFIYLLFHRRMLSKTVITMFRRDFSDDRRMAGLKNKIFRYVACRIGLILYSDSKFILKDIPNALYMPDYLYFDEKYRKYYDLPKQDMCVCLGTMKEDKDLENTIQIFNNTTYKIEIIGKFSDETRFQKLKEQANENILLENRYLSDEEYLKKLATARYSVMPYKESCYKGRTSGIIVESIFVGTVPVAYEFVLENNCLDGIALEKIKKNEDLTEISIEEMTQKYQQQIADRYSVEKYRNILKTRFCKNYGKSIL